jgi:hypothetical protein
MSLNKTTGLVRYSLVASLVVISPIDSSWWPLPQREFAMGANGRAKEKPQGKDGFGGISGK